MIQAVDMHNDLQVTDSSDNTTRVECQHTGEGYQGNKDGYWEYQRMVAFALYLDSHANLPGDKTLGYKIYSM